MTTQQTQFNLLAVEHDSVFSYDDERSLSQRDSDAIEAAWAILVYADSARQAYAEWREGSGTSAAAMWQKASGAAESAWFGSDPRPHTGGVALYWNE